MDQDIDKTLYAIELHNWQIVLLAPRSKKPEGQYWQIFNNTRIIRNHLLHGGNIGLVCGPQSGVLVLDFDKDGVLLEMTQELGSIPVWVKTGSGKFHSYAKWEDNLPAKMFWRGEKIGEIQRGPSLQHVVIPPSVHPNTGLPYLWITDPTTELTPLPDKWIQHFLLMSIPTYIQEGDRRGHPEPEVWDGPPPEEILYRASLQPGAKRRRNGIKFQCPGCRKEGHDKSKDNAIVYNDGRWGCALSTLHRRDIAEVLGFVSSLNKAILGDSEKELRDVSIEDLD